MARSYIMLRGFKGGKKQRGDPWNAAKLVPSLKPSYKLASENWLETRVGGQLLCLVSGEKLAAVSFSEGVLFAQWGEPATGRKLGWCSFLVNEGAKEPQNPQNHQGSFTNSTYRGYRGYSPPVTLFFCPSKKERRNWHQLFFFLGHPVSDSPKLGQKACIWRQPTWQPKQVGVYIYISISQLGKWKLFRVIIQGIIPYSYLGIIINIINRCKDPY